MRWKRRWMVIGRAVCLWWFHLDSESRTMCPLSYPAQCSDQKKMMSRKLIMGCWAGSFHLILHHPKLERRCTTLIVVCPVWNAMGDTVLPEHFPTLLISRVYQLQNRCGTESHMCGSISRPRCHLHHAWTTSFWRRHFRKI